MKARMKFKAGSHVARFAEMLAQPCPANTLSLLILAALPHDSPGISPDELCAAVVEMGGALPRERVDLEMRRLRYYGVEVRCWRRWPNAAPGRRGCGWFWPSTADQSSAVAAFLDRREATRV